MPGWLPPVDPSGKIPVRTRTDEEVHAARDVSREGRLSPQRSRRMDDDVPQITASELKARLDRGDKLTIIDVREPFEWEIGNLGQFGARLMPMDALPDYLDELDPGEELVMQCRSGSRSAQATRFLTERGFPRVSNLKGGLLAWSDEVDPTMPKY
jgi:sulfur-carrier protein adenylyltransferase/sulfurtransferase